MSEKIQNSNLNQSSQVVELFIHYAKSAENITNQRNQANKFFISINLAFISIHGFLISILKENYLMYSFIVQFIGILICVVWLRSIRSYRLLNEAKYSVIHKIEEKLPFNLYTTEWSVLKEENKKYTILTNYERLVPFSFMLVYLIVLVAVFFEII